MHTLDDRQRSTFFRVLGMLAPWRKWILASNGLIIASSVLRVFSLLALLPLLQLAFNPDQEVEEPETVAEQQTSAAQNFSAESDSGEPDTWSSLRSRYGAKREILQSKIGAWAVEDPVQTILVICFVLSGAGVLRLLLELVSSLCITHVQTRFVRDLTRRLYLHVLHHDVAFHRWNPPGKLLARLSIDVNRLQKIVETAYGARVRQPITLAFLSVLLFLIDFRLALLTLVALPLVLLPTLWVARKIREISRKETDLDTGLSELWEEQLSGFQLIKLFGAEEREWKRFEIQSDRSFDRRRKRTLFAAASKPVVELLTVLLAVVLILLGIYMVLNREWIAGETFVLFLITLASFFRPLKKLSSLNVELQRPLMSAEAVFKVLDTEPAMQEAVASRLFPESWREIRYRGVWFRYGRKARYPWIFQSLDLTIPQGEFLAIAGGNGSGKSTLMLLLARLWDPSRGRICLDDVDLRDISRVELRRQIGLIDQQETVFNLTVAENIAFGVEPEEIDRERLVRAVRQAGAARLIESLPEGFETVVGPHGSELSGGERQLLALSRAFYFDFPVLILDEPSRHLDAQAREGLFNSLRFLRGRKTLIVITHDVQLARMADRVVILEEGQLLRDSGEGEIPEGALLESLRVEPGAGSTA